MGVSTALQSEFFRARRMHIGVVLLLLYLGVALLYAFAGTGAWVSAGDEGSFAGFSADPSYFELIGMDADPAEFAVASALAHTVLFPIAAVFVVGMFFGAPRGSASAAVSLARGMDERWFFLARAVISSLYLAAGYVLFTAIAFATYAASGHALDIALLAQRTCLNVLLNVSYALVCVTAFAAFCVRALVAGGLIVVTFAGLIAAMSLPGDGIPVHMSYWMRVCGIGTSGAGVDAVVFALAVSAACILLLFALHRLSRK